MEIRDILKKYGFRFNKALGQNFLTDNALLDAIVADAGVTADDVVVEIGAGAGTLTARLAAVAREVVAFEVDEKLRPVLAEVLAPFDNVRIVFSDVLRMKPAAVASTIGAGHFKVVANLPYYITSDLVMYFLESGLPVDSVTVTVQREVADRFTARPNTPEYGAITLGIGIWGDAKRTRCIDRSCFFPVPNVDSAVVRIDATDRYDGKDKAFVKKLSRAGFAMRRKTLANNLVAALGISRERAEQAIVAVGHDPAVRGEVLGLTDYIALARELKTEN